MIEFVGLSTGFVCAMSGLVARQLWVPILYPWLEQDLPRLVLKRPAFNMDKLLHRHRWHRTSRGTNHYPFSLLH